MTSKTEPLKIQFAPGCFDDFAGTQEELAELIATIHETFANMSPEELAESSKPIDLDEMMEDDPEYAEKIIAALSRDTDGRNLQ